MRRAPVVASEINFAPPTGQPTCRGGLDRCTSRAVLIDTRWTGHHARQTSNLWGAVVVLDLALPHGMNHVGAGKPYMETALHVRRKPAPVCND
jgi:hypothetical protein